MPRKIRKIEFLTPKLPAKKRVAAYARVSSGKDAMLQSLSAQVSHYSKYIQQHHGWEYAGVYADEATSGTKDNRREFQRLLVDCRQGEIDLIITKSISRLARNTVTMLEVVRELKDLNVDIYFEKENIHSMSGDGELMLTILASFAQAESHSVSENCKWRIRKRFAEGELVNLRFIYGYCIKDGKIEVDPVQAEIVRMIFDSYTSGTGCPTIAKNLRKMGVVRPRGGIWNSKRVADIIKNEKYAGNALLQKKYVEDHLTKTVVRNKGELPKYYVENTHPPIVAETTFRKAQEMMAKNRDVSTKGKSVKHYPFTSKIVCGKCGKNYKRKVTRGRVFWNCSTYLEYGRDSCHSKQIPEVILFSLAAEVLELKEFDEAIFKQQIHEIQAPEHNLLIFVFHDGRTIQKQWQHKSRSESWSEEARRQARERQLKCLERRKAPCVQLER
jgi:site-specific DNA recombinase